MRLEGSVFQRAEERWVVKNKDARGTSRYIYRKSKGEVRQVLRQALKNRDESISSNKMIAAAHHLDSWLEDGRQSVAESERPSARSEQPVKASELQHHVAGLHT